MTPILVFHIVVGSLGLLTGSAALLAAKGSILHVRCGIAFWYAMSAMALSGIVIAAFVRDYVFILIGVLALYLVNTGRNALTRPAGDVNITSRFWSAVNAVCFATAISRGLWLVKAGDDSNEAILCFGVAFDSLIFLFLDWRLLKRGQAAGRDRVIDHLWRMIGAMLFGTFALFAFNLQVFPRWFVVNGLNFAPMLVLFVSMAYWIVRVKRRHMKWDR